MARSILLPDKNFYKIGEVAEIVGVKPHALRYWESEFAALRPKKTRGSHRMYSQQDVELAMLIRQLLHDEGYTVAGARRKIRAMGRHTRARAPEPRAAREVGLRAELLGLRQQLEVLLNRLDAARDDEASEAPTRVRVHGVVSKAVLVQQGARARRS